VELWLVGGWLVGCVWYARGVPQIGVTLEKESYTMSRKHYQALARAISTSARHKLNVREYDFLIVSVANMLAADNPQFDFDKWEAACNTEYRDNAA
jgi:hypothetical protein